MTAKQEDVQKGLLELTRIYCSRVVGRPWVTVGLVEQILAYLDSEDVAIKVEGELPTNLECVEFDYALGYHDCKKQHKKAGYTAWERLVE